MVLYIKNVVFTAHLQGHLIEFHCIVVYGENRLQGFFNEITLLKNPETNNNHRISLQDDNNIRTHS